MEIREKIVILNEADEVLRGRGIIGEVRKVEAEALVDTGAVMMTNGTCFYIMNHTSNTGFSHA